MQSARKAHMKYYFTSALIGLAWFGFQYLLDMLDFHMFDHDVLILHALACVVTGLAVAALFRKPILGWTGAKWYLLPVATIAAGTALSGLLTAAVLAFGRPGQGLDPEGWYLFPGYFVLYSVTVFLPVLYPLALGSQMLLRKVEGPLDGGAPPVDGVAVSVDTGSTPHV